MITDDATTFVESLQQAPMKHCHPSTPKAVFLIEPTQFRVSEQTSKDNRYMAVKAEVDAALAIRQHRALAARIRELGVPVVGFEGQPHTPDDLFCNNVFATCAGHLIIGSMKHSERRLEAERMDIRDYFTDDLGYAVTDLSQLNCVAELTGCLVIDRGRQVGFCGMSPRVDTSGCEAMHDAFGLQITFCFDLKDEEYHTNVVMSFLDSRCVVICPDAFKDPRVPSVIATAFDGHVIEISKQEKLAFAGNCLALTARDVMISEAGFDSLSNATKEAFCHEGFVLHPIDLSEIEKAGGSVRCCIGEIY